MGRGVRPHRDRGWCKPPPAAARCPVGTAGAGHALPPGGGGGGPPDRHLSPRVLRCRRRHDPGPAGLCDLPRNHGGSRVQTRSHRSLQPGHRLDPCACLQRGTAARTCPGRAVRRPVAVPGRATREGNAPGCLPDASPRTAQTHKSVRPEIQRHSERRPHRRLLPRPPADQGRPLRPGSPPLNPDLGRPAPAVPQRPPEVSTHEPLGRL